MTPTIILLIVTILSAFIPYYADKVEPAGYMKLNGAIAFFAVVIFNVTMWITYGLVSWLT